MKRRQIAVLLIGLMACARQTPSGSPSPVQSGPAQPWTLRYALLAHYPTFAFCDPDYFPVARTGTEQRNADDWWTRNRQSAEAQAILEHNHFSEPLDASKRLVAYRDHKRLTAIEMTPAAGYDFVLSISTTDKGAPDTTVRGSIDSSARIHERSRSDRVGGCPICLEARTRIATPAGDVEIWRIRAGDLVYSVGLDGRRIVAHVARVARRAGLGPHLTVRLTLRDGRVLVASAAHPLLGGRLVRELRAGERYDGSEVASLDPINSSADATYDILPDGPTHQYWADGILIGSTL